MEECAAFVFKLNKLRSCGCWTDWVEQMFQFCRKTAFTNFFQPATPLATWT